MNRSTESPARTLTILFADLEGSTHLWELHPTEMSTALERHDQLLRRAVENAHGQVVKTTGDGLMAVFSSALDGIQACLQAQQSLQTEAWGETGPLRVRMGLHVGEVQPRAGDFYGPAVNRAARLMAAAHGGQILLSAALAALVMDLLPNGVTLRDFGEHRLKDLARPEHVYQLLHPDLATDFPPLSSLDQHPNNLPELPTPLIGRETELEVVRKRISSEAVRLQTLTGPGGIGKTRLALQVAADLIDQFSDGVFFVDLASIRDPGSVPNAIAQALGLRGSTHRSLVDELKGYLSKRQVLLLLDNFEQVTPAALFLGDLLQACPRLKLLVTSREALHIRGEYIFPVPPLALPKIDRKSPSPDQLSQYEAVRLFIERAQAVKPDFQVTNSNAPAVAEICVRLEGLPLAIELAAARIRIFPPQVLLERLSSRLTVLRGGARDLPARQQTLRGAVDWSYELLGPGEQRLFELLSVFVGGCSMNAVETVANGIEQFEDQDLEIVDGLASLVDKSLVRQVEQGNGESRIAMLETIREYATERLEANPDFARHAHQAHALYYADLAYQQLERLNGAEQAQALPLLISDLENLHTAWNYWVENRDLTQLNKLVDPLWLINDVHGWYPVTIKLTSQLLSVVVAAPRTPELVEREIVLQTHLARALLAVKGYTPEVEQAYTRALELSRVVGEIPQLFPVLRGLVSLYGYIGEFKKAIHMGQEILALAERLGDQQMLVEGHMVLGYLLAFNGEVDQGLEQIDIALAGYDPERFRNRAFPVGNHPGVVGLNASAQLRWAKGFADRSLEHTNKAVELASRLNHPYSHAYAHFHAGFLHLRRREFEPVQKHAQATLEIASQHDFQVWTAVANCLLGAAQVETGHSEEGLAQIDQGIHLYQGLHTPPVFWPLLLHIYASALGKAKQPEQGLAVLEKALDIFGPESEDLDVAEFYRLKGVLLMKCRGVSWQEAESWLLRSVRVARNRQLLMLELRASMDLCRLWQAQGRANQGKEMLKVVYAQFTEGFHTVDLREARELLGEPSEG